MTTAAASPVPEMMGGVVNSERVESIVQPATTIASTTTNATAPDVTHAAPIEMDTPRKSSELRTGPAKPDDVSSSESLHADRKKGSRPKKKKTSGNDRAKSRSVSRKRLSFFSSFLGKKDEHHDEKRAQVDDQDVDAALVKSMEPATAPSAVKTEEASNLAEPPLDAVAVAARVVAQPVVPVEGEQVSPVPVPEHGEAAIEDERPAPITKTEPPTTTTTISAKDAPKASKRHSFFGSLFQRRDSATGPSETTVADQRDLVPAVSSKEVKVSTSGPPTLPEPDVNPPPAMMGVTAEPSESVVTAPVVTSTTPSTLTKDKPSASLTPKEGGFLTRFMRSDKTKVPEAKPEVDPTVDRTSIPNADEAAVAAPEATEVTSTVPTIDPAKEKRRTSFFNNLGGRKERRSDGHGSTQAEAAMTTAVTANGGETKVKGANTTPLPKLGELFRKPSRGARAIFDQGKKGYASASTEPVATAAASSPSTTTAPVVARTDVSEPPAAETVGQVQDPATTTTSTTEPAVAKTD